MRRLALAKDLRAALRRGHPWVYADALVARGAGVAGEVVEVTDRSGGFVARGWFDPAGPIAVRVLTLDPADEVGLPLMQARVRSACALRTAAAKLIDSNAVRLLHGEGDFVPGLVLDTYAGTGVVRFDGEAAAAFWRPMVPGIACACRDAGFPLVRAWARKSGRQPGRGEAVVGDAPPPAVTIVEGAARYEVDVVHGQKTGFFLDQRHNRRMVGELARGASVLNLFGYTGGFSVAAGLGGARSVVTVDASRPAIEAARRNLALNGLARIGEELVAGDAFRFLEDAAAGARRWDLVACDPPSFSPSASTKARALAAYRKLNCAAARVVAPGGILATASCSSHVTPEDHRAEVAAGVAQAGRTARLLYAGGAGPDHPIPPAFPEGRYLKFLLVELA